LMMTLESVMAEDENIDRAIRVNAGLRRRRAEGKIGCGAEIFGFPPKLCIHRTIHRRKDFSEKS
jgi:DNA invertase Pin-like site-specific DNA recombinase